MKSKNDKLDDLLQRHLDPWTMPPQKLSEVSRERILNAIARGDEEMDPEVSRARSGGLKYLVLAVAAIAVFALAGTLVLHFQRSGIDVRAVVESGDGKSLAAGRRFVAGEAVRTGDAGVVLALADGSRVEMRAQSEVTLERAGDGVRIRLSKGGVIVNAAKQHGHLYVQTKDVAVSVVGTVFLVNAESEGSRVAVIEGEVRVKQDATEKSLMPGEQVMSKPRMEWQPVSEEIAWSRHAEEHLALLQQSSVPSAQGDPRPSFVVASLRPAAFDIPTRVRCRGVDGEIFPVSATAAPVPLGRCVGVSVPLKQLVAAAYDLSEERISGVPDGALPTYQLQAAAENVSTVTTEQLRQMLQNLLAYRFKLKVHRETKEARGYVISIGKDGVKFKGTVDDEEPPQGRPVGSAALPAPDQRQLAPTIFKGKFRLKRLFDSWSGMLGGLPVIDKTGLPGIYDINLTLNLVFQRDTPPSDALDAQGPRPPAFAVTVEPRVLANALAQQLGLQMESSQIPIEYLVVDHFERPSNN